MAQLTWVDGRLVRNPYGLNREDLITLDRWKRITVDCPWCLLRTSLDKFATFKKGTKKHPRKLSRKMVMCPECYNRMRIKTLMKATNMSVEDFAYWFWENVFLYKAMEKVDGDAFFGRVKRWKWEQRQVFWNVYREFKSSKSMEQVLEDRESYEEYVATYGPKKGAT